MPDASSRQAGPRLDRRAARPGVTRWTLPSGRIHVTTPTVYDTVT